MPIRNKNSQVRAAVESLKRVSRKNKSRIWKVLAEELSKSRRSRISVNLGQINRLAADDQFVAIPGTLLGGGNLTKSVTVGAFRFTNRARMKLEEMGGKCLSLVELAEMYPRGTGIKILK